MTEQQHLFREAAVRNLNHPDQLDQLMPVLDWRGWIVLAAGALLVLAALVWSIFGTATLSVQGRGMFLSSEGVAAAECGGGGQVTRIAVRPGEVVKAGQLLGTVANPALAQQLTQAEADLATAKLRQGKLDEFYRQEQARNEASAGRSLENLRERVRLLTEHRASLEERLEAQKKLKSGGVSREEEVQSIRARLDEALGRISASNAQMIELENQGAQRAGEVRKALLEADIVVTAFEGKLAGLRAQVERATRVEATEPGRVLEVCVEHGTVLAPGGAFALIGRIDGEPEVVVFFPAQTGRRLRPGMEALIYPAGVPREEYGGIRGEVREVADYLVSAEVAGKTDGNRLMARKIIEGRGALVAARIRLARTADGQLRWSNAVRPEGATLPGTVCEARVIVDKRRPAGLILPHLAGVFGLE